ncbi:hypothetical protein D3C87_1438420 [compost metagenome]
MKQEYLMKDAKNSSKPYGPPRWWESASGAPLAYFLVLGGGFATLALLKELFVLMGVI